MREIFEENNYCKVHSFLMIGQSNMAGRGDIGDVPEINNSKCFMLRCGRWVTMSEPVNPDRAIKGKFASGVCLATSFADEYAKETGNDVGLIPCADGGTVISQWQPGEILYDHAVLMTRLALRSSVLKGILWHQGETDCLTFESVEAYPPKFFNMINSLKKEFPNVPIIIGELSEKIADRNRTDKIIAFNKQLRELVKKIDNCALVSAEGLTIKPDNIHFDSKSLRTFGKRYFEKYCELLIGKY